MRNSSRRSFLRGSAALLAGTALAACTAATSNGVTTITIDVDEVVTDVGIALSIGQTTLGFSGVPAGVVSVVNQGVAIIKTGLAAFQDSAGSSLSLTFDRSSPPAALTSLITDLRTVAANIAAVAESEGAALSSALLVKVSSISGDIGNIASILQAIVGTVATVQIGAAMAASQQRAAQIDAIKARHGLR
ncbi:hypothetical protein AA12717_2958 [Gluconacetobacter sacchari DSM 12717]|uniref:Uncharacterized protein n=2 Tax=Gluconacetobacter sacchari TaxID=92759 RepID=A0A7W4NL27_9PROT|nr:twin-arginine translocation signal domain-containing protein [Gluconacetobacter sacchari]MBB2159749.1 hypothetical protein [Gluconacetobacter sacchari]GBQ28456.1 hypothetical protein AA12717_2958 [Gluconacetobacter sacchari DSM 12717]